MFVQIWITDTINNISTIFQDKPTKRSFHHRFYLFYYISVAAIMEHSKDVGDVFYQLEAGEVDVLLVVDNSCSMEPYQEKLSQILSLFLTYFIEGGIDYRISGVTTTTVSQPPEPDGLFCTQSDINKIPEPGYLVQNVILDKDVQDADAIFQNIVKVGVCGSGSEMGMVYTCEFENPTNGFLRESAYLRAIYVSDEQDTSPLGVNDYINNMRAFKDPSQRDVFNASALVINDIAACDTSDPNFKVRSVPVMSILPAKPMESLRIFVPMISLRLLVNYLFVLLV